MQRKSVENIELWEICDLCENCKYAESIELPNTIELCLVAINGLLKLVKRDCYIRIKGTFCLLVTPVICFTV